MSDTLTIDAVGPMPVVRPATADEVGEIVRRCAADGTAVYPVGGGTMLDYGMPPARPGLAIELRALNKVIDFPASDMTITVEAGITIARLNEITRAEGLHLPIDVPDPERATLGGAIACNVSGPRRYGYGTFRDYILGITTVNDRGEQVSAGGRVVKNVAGYDLMKLHTGALGTLGIITRVTLKLKPVPEEIGRVFFLMTWDRVAEALNCLQRSRTRPVWLITHSTLLPQGDNPPNAPPESRWHWSAEAGFEGNRETVGWQVECMQEELRQSGFTNLGGDIGDTNGFLRSNQLDAGRQFTRVGLDWFCRARAILAPSGVAEFCRLAGAIDPPSINFVFPGSGIALFGLLNAAEWSDMKARAALQILAESGAATGGDVIIERCPPEWKKSLPIWGRPPADLTLQKAVKRALDPKNIFNLGRFVTDAFRET